MKKLFFLSLILLSMDVFSQNKWTLDKAHTGVKFSVTHLVISEVEGNFKSFDATILSSKPDFTDAQINFSVDINSINTDNENRDKHLKSDDFFNAEKYPQMTFKSTSFKKVSGNNYELEGDLTIRDVTKRVKFAVQYNGTIKDPWGNPKAGFKATTNINRFDYNLKWDKLTEAGGAVVGKDVKVTVNLEIQQQKA